MGEIFLFLVKFVWESQGCAPVFFDGDRFDSRRERRRRLFSDERSAELAFRFRRALLLLAEKGEAAFESCIAFLLDCAFVAFLIGCGGGL